MRKIALITGGTGGIGQALCREFSAAGYAVAIHYHRAVEKAEALKAQLLSQGGDALSFRADLSREQEVHRMFAQIRTSLGETTVLVNNAGISHIGLLTQLSLEEWNQVQSVNLTSAFLCCREALPSMIAQKAGAIVNISSMWGQVGASCEVAYSASKAGLIGLTKALAKEVGPSGIQVNCLAPGVIDTPMNQGFSQEELKALEEETPLGALGTPEQIARAALFLAEQEFLTGQVLGVNGGMVI